MCEFYCIFSILSRISKAWWQWGQISFSFRHDMPVYSPKDIIRRFSQTLFCFNYFLTIFVRCLWFWCYYPHTERDSVSIVCMFCNISTSHIILFFLNSFNMAMQCGDSWIRLLCLVGELHHRRFVTNWATLSSFLSSRKKNW